MGWRRAFGWVGPGVVAGASDVDPTTVATLAVIGAGTIYGLGWLTLLLFPIIAVVQALGTQVGLASGLDLPTIVADSRGRLVRWLFVCSILGVNIVTIAADVEGGAAALGLLTDLDWRWFVLPLAVVLLTLLLAAGYQQVHRALRYLLLCLLAYIAASLNARPDWAEVARGSLVPHLQLGGEDLADALSLLGTTLTSYVYIWQTIGQAEEQQPWRLHRARQIDALVGSFFAVAILWFILVATGATLGVHHSPVDTAQQAAQALRPVAGNLAGVVFALGLLASAIVALPVIMATTAYVTGAHMKWRRGLSLRVGDAPLFYTALIGAALLGSLLTFSGISPIRLLFVAGIIGGIATPLGLVLLIQVAGDRKLMNERVAPGPLLAAGWAITGLITLTDLIYIGQQINGGT